MKLVELPRGPARPQAKGAFLSSLGSNYENFLFMIYMMNLNSKMEIVYTYKDWNFSAFIFKTNPV